MSVNNEQKYSLVWQECGDNSKVAERFYVSGFKGYLPFFIYGSDALRLENKESVELKEDNLLKGILYGLNEFENGDGIWHDKENKSTLLYLLDVLSQGFGYQSPEKMILNVAYDTREKVGRLPSCKILETGTRLIPDSSKIKSDLIGDLWALLSSEELEDIRNYYSTKILSLVYQINMADILPQMREIIPYLGLESLIILKQYDKVENYLEEFVYPNVTDNELKRKIKHRLENI